MVPMRAIALPVGWMRISQESNMPTPKMSHILEGPAPTTSVKVTKPIPIKVGLLGSVRLSACSARRPL